MVLRAVLILVVIASQCGCAGSGWHTRDSSAEPLRIGLPLADFPHALPGLYGFQSPAEHRFTIASDGHEMTGMTFLCLAGSYFALFRDGELAWLADSPERSEMRLGNARRLDPLALRDWSLGDHGPTIEPEDLMALGTKRHEQFEAQPHSDNPAFIILLPFEALGAPSTAWKNARYSRAMRTLDGNRFTLGMTEAEFLAQLPSPNAVSPLDGATEYVFGSNFDAGWHEAPVLYLRARDGRLEQVLTRYLRSPAH